MSDASVDSLRAELALLAARFVLPGLGLDVNQAIRVACDLLAQDLDTPATVDVAALAYGTTLRDARPVIRDMLREQGFPAAAPDASEAEEFTTVLRAVGAGGMQIGEFFTFFMRVVPAWRQQDELQRRLVVLFQPAPRQPAPSRLRDRACDGANQGAAGHDVGERPVRSQRHPLPGQRQPGAGQPHGSLSWFGWLTVGLRS